MKILLSGYYGFGNVGDESVLQAILLGLRKRMPDVGITVLSAAPAETKVFHQVNSISRSNPLAILFALLRSNILISGGGTLFQNSTSKLSFFYYIGLVLLAKLLFKKVVIFGQGFGPLNGAISRLIAKLVLNRVDLITLRDSDSYEAVTKLGVKKPPIHVAADPSFILDNPPKEEGLKLLALEGVPLGKRPLIGIAVRSVPRKDESQIAETLSIMINWLAHYYNFFPVFLLFQCPEDLKETSKVTSTLKFDHRIIHRICHPDEMLALSSCFDLLIGMRLHSLVFASMTATPMIGLSYDPKVKAFMKTIGQPYFDIKGGINFNELKAAMKKILAGGNKLKSEIEQQNSRLRRQAATSFDFFFELMRL